MVRITHVIRETQVLDMATDGDYYFHSRTVVSLTDEGDVYAEKALPAHFIAV